MKQWVLGGPILILATCLVLLFFDANPAEAAPPSGFEDRAVANIPAPTATAFTPDGRLLVTSQPGRLYVRTTAGATTVALDIAGKTCSGQTERGMLGAAVDPDFAANNFVYIYYTESRSGVCVNRVSRFTLLDSNAATDEFPVIGNIPSPSCCHQGGDIHFGKDGNLYVSVGDGATQGGQLAQRSSSLLGKILRVRPTATGYDIPAGNPFTGPDSVRCSDSGEAASGPPCQEVFALGLRNPFRMAFDPNTPGTETRFFINDVGQNTWEEVDEGRAGANYGWPLREGPCAQGSTTNCGTITGFTNPIHSYPHSSGCRSITGGAFVPDGLWAGYDGSYLYADFVCDTVFRLSPNTAGGFARSVFDGCLGSPTSLTFGPAGATQGLYYTTYANGGEVRLIVQTGSTSQQPPCPPPPAEPNTSRPVILSPRPAPGAKIKDRTPRITALVRDAQTDLSRNNIRLYFDGRLKRSFSYDRAANRLSYVTPRLRVGRHSVRIVASDGQGRSNARSWSFVVRK